MKASRRLVLLTVPLVLTVMGVGARLPRARHTPSRPVSTTRVDTPVATSARPASTSPTPPARKAVVRAAERSERDDEDPRGDQPDAAFRFRVLQSRDENGKIPVDGLLQARTHVDAMIAAQKERAALAGKPGGVSVAGLAPDDWTWLGPGNIGGRIRSIVIDPSNPNSLWIGSVGGGIWHSTDAGASWGIVDDFMANLAVASMAINPVQPNVMYAGTGEGVFDLPKDGFTADGLQGAGIFKSVDGGVTWNRLEGTNPATSPDCADPDACPWFSVNRLALSPDGATILAATRHDLLQSADGGSTWTHAPGFTGTVYDVDFNPSPVPLVGTVAIAGGSGGAAYLAGGTWSIATFSPELDPDQHARVEVAYAPSNPLYVFAMVNEAQGTLYESSNGGQSYVKVPDQLGTDLPSNTFLGSQGWYGNIVWVNPFDRQFLIVGGVNLYLSRDEGIHWTAIANGDSSSAHADHHMIVASPAFDNVANRTVYFANDGGLYRADDVGTVSTTSGWTNLNNGLGITQFFGAAVNTNGVMIAGSQDNGTPRYTPGDAPSWTQGHGRFGGDGGYCAADPTDVNTFYGEYSNLSVYRSTDGASTGSYIYCNPVPTLPDGTLNPNGGPCTGTGIMDAWNGANFVAPFMLDPNDPNTMLAGGLSLWRSRDVKAPGIPTWTSIKAGYTIPQNPPDPPKPNPISAIAVAPDNSELIVVGHNNGDIWITSDGAGAAPTWTPINHGTPARFVTRLVIDTAHRPSWIYATFGGFSADNVYVTTNLGTTWSDASGSPPSGSDPSTDLPAVPVRALAISPANPDFLYVGTEIGIFASEDAGATWQVPQGGPANVSVDDLFWQNGNLVAVTHGRGIWTTATPVASMPLCGVSVDDCPCKGFWDCSCQWNDNRVPGPNDDVAVPCDLTIREFVPGGFPTGGGQCRNLFVTGRLTLEDDVTAAGNAINDGTIVYEPGVPGGTPRGGIRCHDLVNTRPPNEAGSRGLIEVSSIIATGSVSNGGIIALSGVLDCDGDLSVAAGDGSLGSDASLTADGYVLARGSIFNNGTIVSHAELLCGYNCTLSGTGSWQALSFQPYGAVSLANDVTLDVGDVQLRDTLAQHDHNLTINGRSLWSYGGIDLGTGAFQFNGVDRIDLLDPGIPGYEPGFKGTGPVTLVGGADPIVFNLSWPTVRFQPPLHLVSGSLSSIGTGVLDGPVTIDAGTTFSIDDAPLVFNANLTVNGTLTQNSWFTEPWLKFNGPVLTNNGAMISNDLGLGTGLVAPSTQYLGGTGTWSGPNGSLVVGPNSNTVLQSDLSYGGSRLELDGRVDTGPFMFTMPCTSAWQGSGDVVGTTRRTNMAACTADFVAFGNSYTAMFLNGGIPPDPIDVRLTLGTPSGFPGAVARSYQITPAGGSGYSFYLRLHYLDMELNGNSESALQLYRNDGTGWTAQGAFRRDAFFNYVDDDDVTRFSTWAIGGPNGPPPATAGEAATLASLRASRGAGTSVQITWTPACDAIDHTVYWGTGPIAGTPNWTAAACGLGTGGSGSFDPGDPAPGTFDYFVVVGRTASSEGSYGTSSAGAERPEAVGVGACDTPQVLGATCGP